MLCAHLACACVCVCVCGAGGGGQGHEDAFVSGGKQQAATGKMLDGDFPGGPVFRLHAPKAGAGSNPGWGTKILVLHSTTKNK